MPEAKKETKTYLLPEGRLINSSLFEKDAYTPDRGKPGVPSYKVELVFDPAQVTGVGTIEDDIINACCDEWGDAAEQQFLDGIIRSPFLEGDEQAERRAEKGKAGDAYKGKIVIRANTTFNLHGQDAPGGIQVFDEEVKQVGPANQHVIYPGVFGQAAVTISAYSMPDDNGRPKKGVKFYLVAFQKTKDGEKLVTAKDASTLFKPVGLPAAATSTRKRTARAA